MNARPVERRATSVEGQVERGSPNAERGTDRGRAAPAVSASEPANRRDGARTTERHRRSAIGDRQSKGSLLAPRPSPAPIALHIDELVLHGFPPTHRYRVADALETELRRLLAETGAPKGWRVAVDLDEVGVASIQLRPQDGPEALGRAIAARIYARGIAR